MSPAAALLMAAACMLSAAGLPLAIAATPPPHTASTTATAPAKDEISWVDASVTVEGSVLSAIARSNRCFALMRCLSPDFLMSTL